MTLLQIFIRPYEDWDDLDLARKLGQNFLVLSKCTLHSYISNQTDSNEFVSCRDSPRTPTVTEFKGAAAGIMVILIKASVSCLF